MHRRGSLVLEGKQKTTPMRIRSIDYLRGLCILDMIVTHVLSFWPTSNSVWLFIVEGVTFGSFGEVGFVFVSGIGFGFSWAKQKLAGASNKEQTLKSFSHTLPLLLVSIGFNFAMNLQGGLGWLGFYSWLILQTLAFCRLISLLIMKLGKKARLLIALVLIAFGSVLLNLIDFRNPATPLASFLLVLLYEPLEYYPLMIFFPFFLIGSVLGEDLSMVTSNQVKPVKFAKRWMLFSLCLLVTGLLLGLQLELQTPYNGRPLIDMIRTNPALQVTSFPLLLDLNSYAWSLFFCGSNILVFLSFLYILDMNPSKKLNPDSVKRNLLNLYGRYSLTIYLCHYLAFIIPFHFDASILWLPDILLVVVIYYLILQLDRLGKGKISLEYVIGIGGDWFYRKFNAIGKTRTTPTVEIKEK